MFFLNLTAGEFFALLGTLGGLVTALYLLDRSRRRKVVSTLRFWPSIVAADEQTRRKHMHQPWSLILQLVSLTLLLLAIAQLQWGSRAGRGRDHVLLLDTSVWSGAKVSDGPALDRERQLASRYLEALSARDRVMLVRVDALASPATPFTANREHVLSALRESTSSVSALDLRQAFSFAQGAQNWSGNASGEIVYIGPKRIGTDTTAAPVPANLRVIAVPIDGENAGIRSINVKRGGEKNSWEAVVTLKNEGASPRRLTLKTQFAGTRFSPRVYTLRAGEDLGAKYSFVTNTAGQLIAEIDSDDSLPSDNRAELQLPGNHNPRVAAYTNRRDLLRPLLEANHHLDVSYFDPSQYTPKPAADFMLLDGIAPHQAPAIPSFWIHPPKENSPLPVKSVIKDVAIKTWHTDLLFETGLRARQDRIGEAEVFENTNGAVPIASVAEGPVVVTTTGSSSHPKSAIVGFDPLAGGLRFTVTTPLLFAGLLHWLTPESFSNIDVFVASRIGAVVVPLDPEERPDRLRIIDSRGFAMPFTIGEQTLQLFVPQPTVVHIISGDGHQRTLSFTLPDVAEGTWTTPANTPAGLPPPASVLPTSVDLWKWLACLGGLGIFAEWWIFGRQRRKVTRRPRTVSTVENKSAPKREGELIAK
jgi:hypothetical protein